jgi:hypothetical protein
MKLGARNRSSEHVFPKWLQDRFLLRDQRIRLLNNTFIPYRQLKIPCCNECNTKWLGKVENAVRSATQAGPDSVASLEPLTLFLWLGKIFYGLLYKELLLPRERKGSPKVPIVPRKALKIYDMHHLFLQAARLPMNFRDFVPASIHVFQTQTPNKRRLQFDFRDSPESLAVSCRMGNVGILAALQDGGAQKLCFASDLAKYQAVKLHPLQFIELSAMFFYKASLFNRTPKYLIIEQGGQFDVVQAPLAGFTLRPLFDDWNQEEYARVLAYHLRLPLDQVFRVPGRVATWLHDDNGEVRILDVAVQPWPAWEAEVNSD